MKIKINKYIVADPEICHGKPTFIGTRIMVWQVLEMLETEGVDKILKSYPSLSREHIKAALSYAVSITSGKSVIVPA